MGQLGCGVEQCQLHFLAHIQIDPRVACGQGTPGSPTVPSVTPVPCRSPSQGHQRGCHKVGVSRGVLGEAGGAPAQHHLGWYLSSQHSQCHAEGSEVWGTPPARGIPPAPRTLCLLLPQPSQGVSVSVAGGSGAGVLVGGCCSVPPCPSLLITAEQRSGIKGSH